MTLELFANPSVPGVAGAMATLAAAITTTPAAGTVETITTSGPASAALQATGQFRVLAEAEILLVTGGAATTTWTVKRGAESSTPATHASGTPLNHVVTAGALNNLRANCIQIGPVFTAGPAQPFRQITTALPGTTSAGVLEASVLYNAPDATPSQLVSLGVQSYCLYGSSTYGSTSPIGTVQAFTALVDVVNSASPSNEAAAYMGWMRYQNGAVGTAWFTDWSLHGPIGAQPRMLNGITMLVNNYYNGAPSLTVAAGQWIVTKPGQGAGAEDGHNVARTYTLGVGIGIVGYGGTPGSHTQGYAVGLQIGGYGSGWMTTSESSIVGTGISIADTVTQAIAITPRAAAGAIVWGADTNLYSPSSGIVKTDGKLVAVAGLAAGNAGCGDHAGSRHKKARGVRRGRREPRIRSRLQRDHLRREKVGKLRLVHLEITPILADDDGESLTLIRGNQIMVRASDIPGFADRWAQDFAAAQAAHEPDRGV